jgi:hypothetical protein
MNRSRVALRVRKCMHARAHTPHSRTDVVAATRVLEVLDAAIAAASEYVRAIACARVSHARRRADTDRFAELVRAAASLGVVVPSNSSGNTRARRSNADTDAAADADDEKAAAAATTATPVAPVMSREPQLERALRQLDDATHQSVADIDREAALAAESALAKHRCACMSRVCARVLTCVESQNGCACRATGACCVKCWRWRCA